MLELIFVQVVKPSSGEGLFYNYPAAFKLSTRLAYFRAGVTEHE